MDLRSGKKSLTFAGDGKESLPMTDSCTKHFEIAFKDEAGRRVYAQLKARAWRFSLTPAPDRSLANSHTWRPDRLWWHLGRLALSPISGDSGRIRGTDTGYWPLPISTRRSRSGPTFRCGGKGVTQRSRIERRGSGKPCPYVAAANGTSSPSARCTADIRRPCGADRPAQADPGSIQRHCSRPSNSGGKRTRRQPGDAANGKFGCFPTRRAAACHQLDGGSKSEAASTRSGNRRRGTCQYKLAPQSTGKKSFGSDNTT